MGNRIEEKAMRINRTCCRVCEGALVAFWRAGRVDVHGHRRGLVSLLVVLMVVVGPTGVAIAAPPPDVSLLDQVGGDLDGEAAGDGAGWSVGLSGDGTTVIVGAPLERRHRQRCGACPGVPVERGGVGATRR